MARRKPKTVAERRQERRNQLAKKRKKARKMKSTKEEIYYQLELDSEVLSTPFGDIQTVEADLCHTANDEDLVIELMDFAVEMEEEDDMTDADVSAFLKNTAKRYPNEPIVFHELGKSYFDLGKTKKFKQQIHENYQRFKGYPMIDIAYADLLDKEDKIKFFKEEFKEDLYLPEIYPNHDFFDIREVRLYYAFAIKVLTEMNSFDKARACLKIIEKISSPRKTFHLKNVIDFKQYPSKKWWNLTRAILLILLILGLIVSCIWGIISFFRWLF